MANTQKIKFLLRPQQKEALSHFNRFNVLVCHRRFGKTYLALIWLLMEIHKCKRKNPRGYYYAPNYSQAKKVSWQYIKYFTQHLAGVQYNESELRVNWSDKQIQLGSAENPDSSRGIYADSVVMDEPGQMPQRMFTEVLRPALSDREGSLCMIGTPAGRHGLFFDSWQQAEHDPIWSRHMYKASETGIVSQSELEANRRAMTSAEYAQEWECSFDAAIRGAYYGETMTKIEELGHITRVSHDPELLVNVAFDLGVNDASALWYFQVQGNDYHMIEYEEIVNTGLPDIVKHMKKKNYNYGQCIFPHDVKVRSLSTGQTRLATLQQLGIDCVVAPSLPVIDGIDTARSILNRCWFDSEKCKEGIEAIRQYRAAWKDKNSVLSLAPEHNWASHGADSFRYLAITPLSSIIGAWTSELDYSRMDAGRL